MLLISKLSFFWVGNGAMVKSNKAKYNNCAVSLTKGVNQRLGSTEGQRPCTLKDCCCQHGPVVSGGPLDRSQH